MTEKIQIRRGARPWQPADDVELIETLDFNDMPLTGILRQHGATYLFTCIAGELLDANLWAYKLLPAKQADRITAAGSPDELAQVVDEVIGDGPFVVALAAEEEGILSSAVVETLREPDLQRALDEMVEEFGRDMRSNRDRAAKVKQLIRRKSA